jgi:hypothetical protein
LLYFRRRMVDSRTGARTESRRSSRYPPTDTEWEYVSMRQPPRETEWEYVSIRQHAYRITSQLQIST